MQVGKRSKIKSHVVAVELSTLPPGCRRYILLVKLTILLVFLVSYVGCSFLQKYWGNLVICSESRKSNR